MKVHVHMCVLGNSREEECQRECAYGCVCVEGGGDRHGNPVCEREREREVYI